MDGAALLLLVSAVGVAFGWQPMPDGTPRYEYVVQVDPELAQTLADGKSIPIVSDIPADVQPVGRIRVVVGREAPPRQRLVTLLKPTAADTPASSQAAVSPAGSSKIELAQYESPYGQQRYATAPAQQEPPQTAWNNQQTDPSITPTGEAPPSTRELFGQSGGAAAWNANAAADSVAGAAADALSRVGSDLQRSAQPLVQKGLERVDSEVRGVADQLGERTRGLVDELRHPLQQPQLTATSPQSAAPATSGSGQSWNDDPPAATSGNPLRSDAQSGAAAWNELPTLTQGMGSQRPPAQGTMAGSPAGEGSTGQGNLPQGSTAPPFSAPPYVRGQTGAGGQSGAAQPQAAERSWNDGAQETPVPGRTATSGQANSDDPWANVPDPRTYPAVADSQSGARLGATPETRPLPYGGLGSDPTTAAPQFPPLGVPVAGQQPAAGATAGSPQTGAAATPGLPPVTVGSRMLNQPADRPLDGTATTPPTSASTGIAGNQLPATTPPWPASPQRPSSNAATGPQAAAQHAALNQPAALPPGRDNTVGILVAWVLLSGSIAGNFYLFWSYIDVRHKYRAVVRKTARAVGSRFSAA